MHPLVINDPTTTSHHHPYYQPPQHYMSKPSTPPAYHYQHHHHHHYDTVRSTYHSSSNQHNFAPISPQASPQPPRRASMASPAAILSRQRSGSKTLKDRRKSSGTISTSSQHYHKPRKCIGDYYVGKTLGKGASGRVKLGIHKHTGEQVAIKIISKAHLAANPAIEKAVRREIAIMKLIRHPNVMALVDVIDDPNSSDLNLILEYVQGGELFEYLVSKGRLSNNEARRHFQQIILGLDFCHHHLICHRDLKPENLLLDNKNNIKIADFGMASLQPSGSMLETSCGSPHYASPEIVAGMPYNGSASDIWSCGVILYALLTGHLPFDDENIRQLLKKVKAGKYAMPDDISKNAQDLIRRILVVDPSKRLTMEQIMAHPWFCEVEPVNLATLPVPPTANEIGRPVWNASEIDDRILETIKFLWGETNDDVIVHALVSKEHNMQKVVYVLLQQHAERYWQNDHDDEDARDTDRRYQTIGHRSERNRRCLSMVDSSVRKSHTGSRPTAPWVSESPAGGSSSNGASAPASPSPMTDIMMNSTARRYSASAAGRADRNIPDFMHPPPLPPLPMATMTNGDKSQLKKSETFYSRFIKNVLTSRRSSKSSTNDAEMHDKPDATPDSTPNYHQSTIKSTLAGTLRRKNPFGKLAQQSGDSSLDSQQPMDDASIEQTSESATSPPSVPTKSMLRKPSVSRNRIDPKTQLPTSTSSDAIKSRENTDARIQNTKSTGKTLNTKRLSIRVPNAFKNESGTHRFGFTLNGTRRQRRELDLTMFDSQQEASQQLPSNYPTTHSDLIPPPALSDGSTFSTSSISTNNTKDNNHQQQHQRSNSNHSSSNDVHSSASSSSASSSTCSPITPTTTHQQAHQFKSALKSAPGKGEFLHSPPPASTSSSTSVGGSRRESQVSLHSVSDRRGSNISSTLNRPITPSLLSNSSTITTASGSCMYSPSQPIGSPVSTSSIKGESNDVKASWLTNLFFFKQPKVCSLVIPETNVGTILCTLHRLINQTAEAKFYEKDDKQGIKRYKAEIKTKDLGKPRQVKCRLEILPHPSSSSDSASRLVQFTQQQGDGVVLVSIVRQLQYLLDQEYPTASSAITAGF